MIRVRPDLNETPFPDVGKPTFPVPPWLCRRAGLPAAAPAAINTRRQFHYSKP